MTRDGVEGDCGHDLRLEDVERMTQLQGVSGSAATTLQGDSERE